MKWIALLGIGLALSGCAAVQELSCSGTDPLALGERVGREGGTRGDLEREIAWCAGTSSPLRVDLVERGFAAGERAHCTPDVAFRNGVAGRPLRPICAPSVAGLVSVAHRDGQAVGEIEREIDRADLRISGLEARLDELQRQANDEANQRRRAERDSREIRREIRRLTRRIERLEDEAFLLRVRYGRG